MIHTIPEVLGNSTITLRRYRLDDAATLKESLEASHEHLRTYMPWASQMPTDESVMEFLTESINGFRTDGNRNFAITRTSDGTYVGGCGIHDRVGPDTLEIGYWVDVRHVRQGIATAAAGLLTDACFAAGVERVVIRCDASNEASAAVAHRLGYELAETTDDGMVWILRR